jgi:hypothetical protein
LAEFTVNVLKIVLATTTAIPPKDDTNKNPASIVHLVTELMQRASICEYIEDADGI